MENLALSSLAGNYLLGRMLGAGNRIVEMYYIKSGGGLATAPKKTFMPFVFSNYKFSHPDQSFCRLLENPIRLRECTVCSGPSLFA